MRKPTIFFSSTKEDTAVLKVLMLKVTEGDWAYPQSWTNDTFRPGEPYLTSFKQNTADCDFAVLVFSPIDTTFSRGTSYPSPRDNLVFELGYFLSLLSPERVVVVAPKGVDMKIPSNYYGHKIVTYDRSSGPPTKYLSRISVEISTHFQTIWNSTPTQLSTEGALEKLNDSAESDIVYKKYGDQIIPIYRDLSPSLDWYSEFESSMRSSLPSLNTKMLYHGPGLSRNWFTLNEHYDAYKESIASLTSHFETLFLGRLSEDTNIIDLGVGDFEKGNVVLSKIFESNMVIESLRYFPMDISYNMLTLAFGAKRASREIMRTLKKVRTHGTMIAINSTFSHLNRYRHLFRYPCSNFFLFLGNTLGNELNEKETLREIARCMNPGDHVLVEIQLLEEKPYSVEQITEGLQVAKYFYAGPFLSLGYQEHEIDLVVTEDSGEAVSRGVSAITYKAVCQIKKAREINSPSFDESPVRVPSAEICTAINRKYIESKVETLFSQTGLELIEFITSSPADSSSRRFGYMLGRRKK